MKKINYMKFVSALFCSIMFFCFSVIGASAHGENERTSVYDGLVYEVVDGNIVIVGYNDVINPECVIPGEIDGKAVTAIGDFAFEDCERLKSVIIPDGVTSIGEMAFVDCVYLESIAIPDSVTQIGVAAFNECERLYAVTIPAGIRTIIPGLFAECEALEFAEIPDGVTVIGQEAFEACYYLGTVVIPASVTSIDKWAFNDADFIKKVYYRGSEEDWKKIAIGEDNEYLLDAEIVYNFGTDRTVAGEDAGRNFVYSGMCGEAISWGLTDTNELVIEGSGIMYEWDEGDLAPWYACRALIKSITISGEIPTIGKIAFYGCPNLESVRFTDRITTIEECAFNNCASIKDIYFAGSKSQWKKIVIDPDNIDFSTLKIHYNDEPAEEQEESGESGNSGEKKLTGRSAVILGVAAVSAVAAGVVSVIKKKKD